MNRVNKKVLGRLLTLVLFLIFFWYFANNIEDFKNLLNINPLIISLLIIINISGIIINGVFMKFSIALFNKNINYRESVKVSLISALGNFFAPAGSGLGFRAIYLKKQHKLAYSDYISVVFCNYVLVFLLNSLLALGALYTLRQYSSSSYKLLVFIFAMLLLLSVSAFFIHTENKYLKIKKQSKFNKVRLTLERIANGWKLMLSHKRTMIKLITLILINTILVMISSYLLVVSVGAEISLAATLLLGAMGSLSIFVNITPGNLGVKEAIIVVFSTVIGLSASQVLSMAIIDRAIMFLVLIVLWLINGRKTDSS
jgi:hypothetical protein